MKNLQSELKNVSKTLASLSQKVEKLTSSVQKPKTVKKTAAKKPVAKKAAVQRAASAGGKTVLDTVFDAIKRSKKGVTVAQLKTKTQLNARQLSNALYKLSKKGMVKAPSRGLYLKK
jgi:predicted Rossmann fold nucleotide-binding protein DprA/Smf involved in DNA uptake